MYTYLLIGQIVSSVVLIILILLQQGGTALGSSFGQEGGAYATKRGAQKQMFLLTVVMGIIFIVLSILNLFF